jgi:hypothetical protein
MRRNFSHKEAIMELLSVIDTPQIQNKWLLQLEMHGLRK